MSAARTIRPIDRRTFVGGALATLACAPLPSSAQPGGRTLRVALLLPADLAFEASFHDALGRLGYVVGRNLALDRRSANGDIQRLPALATELVRGNPDVVVAFVTQASVAAKKATARIPIVMVGVSDPVASGLVASLSRPGGNVTGTAGLSAIVVGKQFELLRELVPDVSRAATLWNPTNLVFQAQAMEEARAAAGRLGIRLVVAEIRTVADIEPALARAMAERPQAAIVLPDPLLASNAKRIADAMLARRLPSVGSARAYADSGLLASFGPDFAEAAQRAADIVDRIARGKPPGDIPIEVVTKFDLVVNLSTAKALGISVQPAVLARAELIR